MDTIFALVGYTLVFTFAFTLGWLARGGTYKIDPENVNRWLIRMDRDTAKDIIKIILRGTGYGWVTGGFIFNWAGSLDQLQRDKELYHLVKSVYNGRRTIHKCPQRKIRTGLTVPLDPPRGDHQLDIQGIKLY